MCVAAGGCVVVWFALELAKEGIWGCAGQCDTPVLFHGGASFSVEERMACMYVLLMQVLLLVTYCLVASRLWTLLATGMVDRVDAGVGVIGIVGFSAADILKQFGISNWSLTLQCMSSVTIECNGILFK